MKYRWETSYDTWHLVDIVIKHVIQVDDDLLEELAKTDDSSELLKVTGKISSEPDEAEGILIIAKDSLDALLVVGEIDFGSPSTHYYPGGRLMLDGLMQRIARYIINEGIENSSGGNWIVKHGELKDCFSIDMSSPGAQILLQDKLKECSELQKFEINNVCCDISISTEYRQALDAKKQQMVDDDKHIAVIKQTIKGKDSYYMVQDARSIMAVGMLALDYLDEHTAGLDAAKEAIQIPFKEYVATANSFGMAAAVTAVAEIDLDKHTMALLDDYRDEWYIYPLDKVREATSELLYQLTKGEEVDFTSNIPLYDALVDSETHIVPRRELQYRDPSDTIPTIPLRNFFEIGFHQQSQLYCEGYPDIHIDVSQRCLIDFNEEECKDFENLLNIPVQSIRPGPYGVEYVLPEDTDCDVLEDFDRWQAKNYPSIGPADVWANQP